MNINVKYFKQSYIKCINSQLHIQSKNYSYSRESNNGTENYYHILGLQSNCSTNDIKNAYIRFCKELHPDINPGNTYKHEKFIRLNEAYKVLSKPDTRFSYDVSLTQQTVNSPYHVDIYHPYRNRPDAWSRGHSNSDCDNFYGIPGIRRVPNSWIVSACLVIILFGLTLNFVAFKYRVGVNRLMRKMEKEKEEMKLHSVDERVSPQEAIERLEMRYENYLKRQNGK